MEPMEYLWKDRKRHLGLPLSFTRYRLSEDREDLTRLTADDIKEIAGEEETGGKEKTDGKERDS